MRVKRELNEEHATKAEQTCFRSWQFYARSMLALYNTDEDSREAPVDTEVTEGPGGPGPKTVEAGRCRETGPPTEAQIPQLVSMMVDDSEIVVFVTWEQVIDGSVKARI